MLDQHHFIRKFDYKTKAELLLIATSDKHVAEAKSAANWLLEHKDFNKNAVVIDSFYNNEINRINNLWYVKNDFRKFIATFSFRECLSVLSLLSLDLCFREFGALFHHLENWFLNDTTLPNIFRLNIVIVLLHVFYIIEHKRVSTYLIRLLYDLIFISTYFVFYSLLKQQFSISIYWVVGLVSLCMLIEFFNSFLYYLYKLIK